MKFKIGFSGYEEEQQTAEQLAEMPGEMQPVKSVVQVRFPSQGRSYSYYNDRFDLHVGDIVFVEGKLEGVSDSNSQKNKLTIQIASGIYEKSFSTDSISPLGQTTLNNLRSVFEEYNDALEPDEKLAILSQLIEDIIQ